MVDLSFLVRECEFAAIIASYVSDANYVKHIHWHRTLQQEEGGSND
jgi:hypothetical protein